MAALVAADGLGGFAVGVGVLGFNLQMLTTLPIPKTASAITIQGVTLDGDFANDGSALAIRVSRRASGISSVKFAMDCRGL